LALTLEVPSGLLPELLLLAPPRSRLMAFTIGAIWTAALALVAWGLWRLMSS
jgi:hypothetical protein